MPTLWTLLTLLIAVSAVGLAPRVRRALRRRGQFRAIGARRVLRRRARAKAYVITGWGGLRRMP
jgi:hypothetical protein